MLRPEVLQRINVEPAISETVRQEALGLAQDYPEDGPALSTASLVLAMPPDAEPSQYVRALAFGEAAFRLRDDDSMALTSAGIARYRLGQFREAVDTLLRAEKVLKPIYQSPHNHAFLAMAYHKLGEEQQAQAALKKFREVILSPEWLPNPEVPGLQSQVEMALGK
jgi:tetratricopeptide (TPR) repeat protein